MLLITCPDCQAAISDSAPACLRCGRPMQGGTLVQPLPSQHATAPREERVLLQNDLVTVTSARVVVRQKTTYALANITSVSEFIEPRPAAVALMALLLATMGLFCVGFSGTVGGVELALGAVLLVVFFLIQPKHWVRLGTAGAEQNAVWSHDALWTREVVSAITHAMAGGGPLPPPRPPQQAPRQSVASQAATIAVRDGEPLWAFLERVSARTWKIVIASAVLATIGFVAWAAWYFGDARTIRRHQAEYMAENCYGIKTFADCEALVSKRDADARRQREVSYRANYARQAAERAAPRMLDAVGDVGVLTKSTPLFDTRAYLDEAAKLARAHDKEGFSLAASVGSKICDEGTKVRILEAEGNSRRLRILSGPFYAQDGWTVTGVVRSE
jgi:hypothetical protein